MSNLQDINIFEKIRYYYMLRDQAFILRVECQIHVFLSSAIYR